MLKESGRERINAVYGTKEQCRKEFQDEITRLRNQFQLVCKVKKKTKYIFSLDILNRKEIRNLLE